MTTHIESGIQLLARVNTNKSSKKSLVGFEDRLFPEGLQMKQTVEISGDPGSGKTLLLTQLIATCILPTEYKGFDVTVLLINTDHHFQIGKVIQILRNFIEKKATKSETWDEAKCQEVIKTSLKNLLVINCTNNCQFACNLHSLPSIFSSNNKIGIVALDSISAFYWQDRELIRKNSLSMSIYVSDLLKTIHQAAFQFSVKTIFTKQDFETKTRSFIQRAPNSKATFGEVNHRIFLSKDMNSSQGKCKVESDNGSKSINYETTETGLKWL